MARGSGPAHVSDEDDNLLSSAGQPPKSPSTPGPIHLEEFNETLHERIVKALGHQKVIDTITKTVTKAILDTVTQRVYQSLDHDVQAKLSAIQKLEKEVNDLQRKLADSAAEIEEQESYSRRNCLRIHGLTESDNEDTNELIVKFAKEKLQIDMVVEDIDRSHRLHPRNSDASEKPKL